MNASHREQVSLLNDQIEQNEGEIRKISQERDELSKKLERGVSANRWKEFIDQKKLLKLQNEQIKIKEKELQECSSMLKSQQQQISQRVEKLRLLEKSFEKADNSDSHKTKDSKVGASNENRSSNVSLPWLKKRLTNHKSRSFYIRCLILNFSGLSNDVDRRQPLNELETTVHILDRVLNTRANRIQDTVENTASLKSDQIMNPEASTTLLLKYNLVKDENQKLLSQIEQLKQQCERNETDSRQMKEYLQK